MMRSLLSLAFVCLIHFLGGIRDENMRSSYLNMMPHHRLTGHLITTTTADTEQACALMCLRNEECKSCNFQAIPHEIGICELNSKTLRSLTYDPALIYDENFVFISLENVSFSQTLIVKHYFRGDNVHLLITIFILVFFLSIRGSKYSWQALASRRARHYFLWAWAYWLFVIFEQRAICKNVSWMLS